MAQEDAGRPLHSAGTDGQLSSSVPGSRSNHSRASPSRERRPTNNTKNGDGTEFPRFFLQLGHDIKRTRGYEMIQELQIMVCSKDAGIKGNAARARVMVLLKEVQGVLIGLENKVDAQTYELGVFNVERSELRKELRDEKAKEVQPLHTIDFRNTEVKDLPHKLRTLFEDNQVLREQVRALQYSVRSAETRLDTSERKAAALEAENSALCIALREAGSSVDIAQEVRQLREATRNAEARAMQAEMQMMSMTEQLEAERRMLSQHARTHATKQSMLEARLSSALGVAPVHSRLGGGSTSGSAIMARKSSARSAVYDPAGMDDGGGGGSLSGRAGDGGGSLYGASSLLDGATGGGGGGGGVDGRSSAHSRAHSGASGGAGAGAGARSSAGRERSVSPPRSPSGRSISHNPGSVIPALYPLFNAKPRPTHGFSQESSSWLTNPAGGPATPGAFGAGGGISGGGAAAHGGSFSPSHLPPPPNMGRNLGTPERPAGGPVARPSSGIIMQGAPMDTLQEARPSSSASTGTSLPGEPVRAINSAAVVTSRTLLPSVSGASGGATSRSSGTGGGAGILGLRVGMAGGGGGSGVLRRSSGSDGSFQGAIGGGSGSRQSSIAGVAEDEASVGVGAEGGVEAVAAAVAASAAYESVSFGQRGVEDAGPIAAN